MSGVHPNPYGPSGRAALAAAFAALLCIVTPGTCSTAVAAAASAASAGASQSELGVPSEAERLLFLQPHLNSIREPRTLTYDYMSQAASAPRVDDHATLALTPAPDGRCCSAHIDYLSGPLSMTLPDLDQPQGNPILMYFLESEVRLLERTTHGQAAHFRRRIRQAFADDASIQDTTARWGGKDVSARVVHIVPFRNDPYRVRFEREAATEYWFVISEAVPGGFVRMAATLPGQPGAAPLAQRTLAIADPQPAAPAKR